MHVLKAVSRWQDFPKEYGPHKTVYNRFCRWSEKGVWQKIFEFLAGPSDPPEQAALDSSHVEVHRCANGGKRSHEATDGRARVEFGVRHPTLEIAHGDLEAAPTVRCGEACHFVRGFGNVQIDMARRDSFADGRQDLPTPHLAGGDATALLSPVARKRGETQAALLRPQRVMSCYEAGYDGFWLHRLLGGHEIDNRVLDAASILVERRFRQARRIAWMWRPCCER